MSTLQEIRSAIGNLSARDKALLAAELFALSTEPEEKELEGALERGLADVGAGRVRPIEEVKGMIPGWTSTRESFRSESCECGERQYSDL